MDKEEWKLRKVVQNDNSRKMLQDTINSYETKLCEMHSELLVLRSDNNRLSSDLRTAKKSADYNRISSDQYYKTVKVLEHKVKMLLKFIRSKWYLRFSLGKQFLVEAKRIVRGW